MLDYTTFPPIQNFLQVLKHCPECALTFTKLWGDKDKNGHITVEKMDVRNHFNISPTILRNNCLDLHDEQILVYEETDRYFFIDFLIK
jgi:hypothetical protein